MSYDNQDAYLIAAAPELLGALEALLNGLWTPKDAQDHSKEREEASALARAAIAKAKGN